MNTSNKWYYFRMAMMFFFAVAFAVASTFTVTAREIPAVIAWVIVAAILVVVTRSCRWEERQENRRWKRATRAAEEDRAEEDRLQRALKVCRPKS